MRRNEAWSIIFVYIIYLFLIYFISYIMGYIVLFQNEIYTAHSKHVLKNI